jgi:site-specific recombinase XerD
MRRTALALLGPATPLALLESEAHNAKRQEGVRATNTLRAYAADWRAFEAWCEPRGVVALDAAPARVARYLSDMERAGRKLASIERALSAVAQRLEGVRLDSEVRATMKGIRRAMKHAPVTRKAPVLADILPRLVEGLGENPGGLRDRALLTLGFAGAFRRSELVALDVADVAFVEDGLIVQIRSSKTDQEGKGRSVGIPYASTLAVCPVRSLRKWLGAAGFTEGAIFRSQSHDPRHAGARLSGAAVATLVKAYARAAGLDPAKYSGHSLRAGFATSAAMAGKSDRAIMAQTGHKSAAMLARYVRDVGLFDDNAATGLL